MYGKDKGKCHKVRDFIDQTERVAATHIEY